MKDSPLLRTLRTRLKTLDATIARTKAERLIIRQQLEIESARLQLEDEKILADLEPRVRAAWESGVPVEHIATAHNCAPADVRRIMKAWRQREGVTVRRRRPKTRGTEKE